MGIADARNSSAERFIERMLEVLSGDRRREQRFSSGTDMPTDDRKRRANLPAVSNIRSSTSRSGPNDPFAAPAHSLRHHHKNVPPVFNRPIPFVAVPVPVLVRVPVRVIPVVASDDRSGDSFLRRCCEHHCE
jgi:hypothetical protein